MTFSKRPSPLPAALVVALVALAACGSKPRAAATPSATPSPPPAPTPTQAASPAATASPTPSRAAPRSPGPAPSPTRASTAPSPAAPAGPAVQAPRLGTYTYALSGTTQSPILGLRGPYPPGAVESISFAAGPATAQGTQEVATSSSQQDGVLTTVTSVWGATGVTVAHSTLTFLGIASYDCTYSPAPLILPSPLRTGTLASQSWSGAQCSGSVQVSVLDEESVTAAGRTWDVFRVHSVLHYTAQSSVDVTNDATSLVSPELGTVVTSDATSSGTVTGNPFAIHQVTTLTSHP